MITVKSMRVRRTASDQPARRPWLHRLAATLAIGSLLVVLLGIGRDGSLDVGWLVPLPEHNGPGEAPIEHNSTAGVHDKAEYLLTSSEHYAMVPPTARRQRTPKTELRLPRTTLGNLGWRGFRVPLRC